jgi:hypothetical protein
MTVEGFVSVSAVVLAVAAVLIAVSAVRGNAKVRLDEQEIAVRAVSMLRTEIDIAKHDAAEAWREATEARREAAETRRFNDALLRYIDDLLAGIERLYTQIAAVDGTPVYRPGPRPTPQPTSNAPARSSLSTLMRALEESFTLVELDEFAQALETTLEHVGGDTIRDAALGLMRYAQTRGKLDDLFSLVRQARPNLTL